ncbi:aminopeptidase N [Longispora sp. NPDC051575]|uniref:aminopeptidase N n=1 Tax=Longispora sp. NPDC051575 TaxID=3154943 RepID=UPI0034268BB4
MPPLQRTEARVRADLIEVHRYELDLDLTRPGDVFGCTTVIRFGCARPGAGTFLDLRPATLRRVVLNGRALDPADLADHRFPLADLAADNELLIEADMAYSRTGEGLHRFTDPLDGEVYVHSSCAPDLAPLLFACFDQPDLKASFVLGVTAPAGWTVLGNAAGEHVGGGRWEFAPTPPISTYLAVVAAGPLHSVHAEHDGIPLGLHSRRSLAADLDREADELFEVTAASFDRLHELFADRYAFGRYDQAFVPELNWGAMENPGCVLFAEEFLFHSAPTEADRANRAVVVAHEMAHMWFGDLVTMRWWDDLWLNESFAEYLGYRVTVESTRFTDAWTHFATLRKGWGYDADQRPSTHPIAASGIESLSEAMANFDGISYAKGAAALRQLVVWLGDDAFFEGVNAHLARHRFGNADLADLLDALATASGRDVPGWASLWLRTSGVDTLRVERAADGAVELVADGSRPHLVGVGVFEGRPPVLRSRVEVEVEPGGRVRVPDSPDAVDAAPVGQGPGTALVLPNHGDLTWAKVRLDADSWRTVTASLSAIEDPLTRAVLWAAARDLVRDADLSPAAYLDLVAAHLPAERTDSIVQSVLTFAGSKVVGSYLAPDRRPAGHALLAGVARRLLDVPDADQGLRLAALGAAIDNATDPAELEPWLADGGAVDQPAPVGRPPGDGSVVASVVPPAAGGDRPSAVPAAAPGGPGPAAPALSSDLRWAALARLAALGEVTDDRLDAELAADPSGSAHQGAARARAALPDPAAKERAWRGLFTDGELSPHLITATAQGFWQSGSEELHGEYQRRYFADVPTVGARGDAVASVLGGRLFPAGHSTPDTVLAAGACLAAADKAEDATPVLRRALADQLDDLRRAVRIRERFAGE